MMSPEVGPMEKRIEGLGYRLLRFFGTLAVVLVCALLFAGHARAWTEIPEEAMNGLTPEQQTLIQALPEADRPLCYCWLTGTDVSTFFKQYSGYADLIDREGLKSAYTVGRYINGMRHPDFSTPEGQLEKQFLFELYFGLFGEFGSYTDLTRSSVSTSYSEPLQNRTLEQLQTLRESLDTGRVFYPEEMPMWKSIVDAFITYRGGSPESQTYGADREFLNLYHQAAYVPLEGDEAQLLEEMPEVYKLLTYAALSGTDGLGWLRENSPVSWDFIEQYWDTWYRDLQVEFADVAKTYGTDSDEAMFLLQLFGLRTDHYVWFNAGTWGIEYRDTIRIQNLPRSGDKIMDSLETVKEYLDRNSASIFWDELGADMGQCCRAWIAYFRRIASEAVAGEWDRREEAEAYAARVAGLDWEAIQEKSDAYRQETGAYALPQVTGLPVDSSLAEAEREFLGNVAPRYLPQAYRYLRPDLSTEEVFAACLQGAYRTAAETLLSLNLDGLKETYLELAVKAALEGLGGEDAAQLELCAEILLCRWQDMEGAVFGELLINYDKKKAGWAVEYYTGSSSSDPLGLFSYETLTKLAERRRTQGNSKLLNDVQYARNYDALAQFKKNRKLLPAMSAAGKRVYDATMPDMQVYAAAIVSGLIEPVHDPIYAEMPEQLRQRWLNNNYGSASNSVLISLVGYYGEPDYHETDHPSYYTASDSVLEAILNSVNEYTPEAKAEAQRILWHRSGEFYSTEGNYHAKLHQMSVKALYNYRKEMETKYYAASDAAGIAELTNWIEQVSAWMAWRNERGETYSARTENTDTDTETGWSGIAPDLSEPAADRTYILEIATGKVAGEHIEFFRIVYETDEGDTRTQYIFPTEDSLHSGYRMAANAGTPKTVLDWVSSVVGYDTADPLHAESLQSFHTDQFLFTADGTIARVTEIQAFMRQDGNSGKNEWTCTGLRLYQVETLCGLQRYGYYSSDCYIDFSGKLLTELRFEDESRQNISWRGSDTLFRFGGSQGTEGYSLVSESGRREVQSNANNVIFRIDFADQYMAGLECLATGYQGSNSKSISRPGNLCEALTLQVRYRDVFGSVRDVALPAICSTAAWSVLEGGVSGIQDYAGLAQQGESIAFGGTLPDLAEVLYVSPVLGGDAAAAAAQLTPGKEMSAAALRDSRIAASNSEMASILAIVVYDAERGTLRARYEDSFLRFDFPTIPEKYYRAADITGLRLDAGGATGQLTMESYTEGTRLLPNDRQERYLVTLYTDDADLAGTSSDVFLRLSYEDVDGNMKQTTEFSLREYAGDFYGYWPASVEDFGYLYSLSSGRDSGSMQGQSLSVLLPIQDVQRFTDVTIRLGRHDGEAIDEWQMKDLTVQTVSSIGQRRAAWKRVTASSNAVYSDRVFTREVAGDVIFTLSQGGAVDPTNPVHTAETVFEPELFQDGEAVTIDITTPDVVERHDVDWRSLRYDMTYADTQQDLGFLKARANYTVQVKVASNVDNISGEDDCGSKNQFYFQLLFAQGGKSAVVLANQQLQSDGFHAGSTESFTISTNQEYGEISAIRIIPEDMASDSDKYDKLKIDTITVIQDGDGQLSPLWRFKDVGWIGIDYRDEGEENSLSGITTRTMDELSHIYNVTESSYAVNVQFAISTGQYKDRKGEVTEQFQGEMSAEVTYRDVNGIIQRQYIEDVVALMYAFNNRTVQYNTVTSSNGSFTGGHAVSDPNYMFRANHTDRFIVSLDGLEQILNIKLYPRSSVNTVWNISDVNVCLIQGQGRRILNVAGEYTMKYPKGQELLSIAYSDSTGEPKYTKQLYISGSDGGVTSPITVNFTAEKVQTSTTLFESQTVVSELPAGGFDSFNFVVYPTSISRSGINNYDLTVSIRYTTTADTIVQNSAVMNKATVDGEPVFYLEGLTADGLAQLNSVGLKSSSIFSNGVSGGFVQRVRGGFVVETYELGEMTGLEHGAEVPFVSADTDAQTVCFQLGPDMPDTKLKNGGNDVAVSIHYRIEGPFGREYQSRRYFLTNEGYSALRAGQIVELVFRESHVAEITGVSFIPTGQTGLDLGNAYVTCSRTDASGTQTETGRYSLAGATSRLTSGVIRRNISSDALNEFGSVQPLYLRFATGNRQENAGTGIDSPVSMTLGCYDSDGILEERTYADIRPYIQNTTRRFTAGGETEAIILVEDMQDVRWMDLTVRTSDGGQLAIWDLNTVTLRLGDSGQTLRRELTEPLPEGETVHLSFANVNITGDITYPLIPQSMADGENETVTVHIGGGETGILLKSGQGIWVEPSVTGSSEGFRIELRSLEPSIGVTGKASLTSSHSYTGKYLNELREEAGKLVESGSADEANAARRVLEVIQEITESKGSFTEHPLGATFMTPRNFTGSNQYYRLIVTSVETGDTAFTIDLTVQSEADPLGEAITALRTVQNNELLKKMNEELANISVPTPTVITPGDNTEASGEDEPAEGEEPTEEASGETPDSTDVGAEDAPEAITTESEAPGTEVAEETPESPDSGAETEPEAGAPAGDGTEGGAEEA